MSQSKSLAQFHIDAFEGLNTTKDASLYIGENIFQALTPGAGQLALLRAIENSTYGQRNIYPNDTPSILEETTEYFNKIDEILQYYGIPKDGGDIDIFLNYWGNLKSPSGMRFESMNIQRDWDSKSIISFLSNAIFRISEEQNTSKKSCKINVIDLGGAVGTQFYATGAICNPFIKKWCVVDLPMVIAAGKYLKEKVLERHPTLYEKMNNKLCFSPNIEQFIKECGKDDEVVIIMNGVYMHLPDPKSVIRKAFEIKPKAFFMGNNFEMGPTMLSCAKKLKKDYFIVGDNKHKFLISKPGGPLRDLESLEELARRGRQPQYNMCYRDSINMKIYTFPKGVELEEGLETKTETSFVESELNQNYSIFF